MIPSIKVVLIASIIICQLLLIVEPGYATITNVNIQGLAFTPQGLTITTGQTVNWTNNDPVSHTLWFTNSTDGSTVLLSPPIGPGSSWAHSFSSKANLNYYDLDRLWINGTLTVLPTVALGGRVNSRDPPLLGSFTVMIMTLALTTTALAVLARRLTGGSLDRFRRFTRQSAVFTRYSPSMSTHTGCCMATRCAGIDGQPKGLALIGFSNESTSRLGSC